MLCVFAVDVLRPMVPTVIHPLRPSLCHFRLVVRLVVHDSLNQSPLWRGDEVATQNNFPLVSKKNQPHFRVIILNFRFDTKSPFQCLSSTFAMRCSRKQLPSSSLSLCHCCQAVMSTMTATYFSKQQWSPPLDCRLKEQLFKPCSSPAPPRCPLKPLPTQSMAQERCLHQAEEEAPVLLGAYSAGLNR